VVEVVEDVVDEEEGADAGGGGTGTGTGGTSKCVGVFINKEEPSNCAHAFYRLQVNNNSSFSNHFANELFTNSKDEMNEIELLVEHQNKRLKCP
jgi:hypothetical protein